MPRTSLGAWLHPVIVVNCLVGCIQFTGLTPVTIIGDTRRGHNTETRKCTSTCRTQLSPPSGALPVPSLHRYQTGARRLTDGTARGTARQIRRRVFHSRGRRRGWETISTWRSHGEISLSARRTGAPSSLNIENSISTVNGETTIADVGRRKRSSSHRTPRMDCWLPVSWRLTEYRRSSDSRVSHANASQDTRSNLHHEPSTHRQRIDEMP